MGRLPVVFVENTTKMQWKYNIKKKQYIYPNNPCRSYLPTCWCKPWGPTLQCRFQEPTESKHRTIECRIHLQPFAAEVMVMIPLVLGQDLNPLFAVSTWIIFRSALSPGHVVGAWSELHLTALSWVISQEQSKSWEVPHIQPLTFQVSGVHHRGRPGEKHRMMLVRSPHGRSLVKIRCTLQFELNNLLDGRWMNHAYVAYLI